MIIDIETRGLIRNFSSVLDDSVIEVLAPAFHSYLISCTPQVPSERLGKMLQRVTIAQLRQDGSVAGLIVTIEDVTGRVDNERDSAAKLTQGGVRNEEILAALGDESWRIRREQTIEQGLATCSTRRHCGAADFSQRESPQSGTAEQRTGGTQAL